MACTCLYLPVRSEWKQSGSTAHEVSKLTPSFIRKYQLATDSKQWNKTSINTRSWRVFFHKISASKNKSVLLCWSAVRHRNVSWFRRAIQFSTHAICSYLSLSVPLSPSLSFSLFFAAIRCVFCTERGPQLVFAQLKSFESLYFLSPSLLFFWLLANPRKRRIEKVGVLFRSPLRSYCDANQIFNGIPWGRE